MSLPKVPAWVMGPVWLLLPLLIFASVIFLVGIGVHALTKADILDPQMQIEACVNRNCIVRLKQTQCLYSISGGQSFSGSGATLIHCLKGSETESGQQ